MGLDVTHPQIWLGDVLSRTTRGIQHPVSRFQMAGDSGKKTLGNESSGWGGIENPLEKGHRQMARKNDTRTVHIWNHDARESNYNRTDA